MKNNNPNSNWARGPVVRGPTVRPEKVANWAPDSWAPEMYHAKKPKNHKKKQNTASKMQTGVFPNIKYVAQHTKCTNRNTKYISSNTK